MNVNEVAAFLCGAFSGAGLTILAIYVYLIWSIWRS